MIKITKNKLFNSFVYKINFCYFIKIKLNYPTYFPINRLNKKLAVI